MTKSILDHIETWTGERLTERSLRRLGRLSYSEAAMLVDSTRAAAALAFDPTEAKPLTSASLRYAVLADVDDNMDAYEMWGGSDRRSLKKLLLYYPSIAVLDPTDELLGLCAEAPSQFEKALAPLLPVRPLLESGVITLVPGSGFRHFVSKMSVAPLLADVLQSDDAVLAFREYDSHTYDWLRSEGQEILGSMLDAEERKAVHSLERTAAPAWLLVWCAMLLKEAHARACMADFLDASPAFTSPKKARLLSTLLGADATSLQSAEDGVAPLLLSLPLPNLDEFDWNDLVAIRQSDEDFNVWRVSLERALRRVNLPEAYEDKAFCREVKTELSANLAALRVALSSKMSLKSKILDSVIPAGFGFVAGAYTGNVATAALSSTVTGCLALLYSIVAKRPTSGQQALFRHAALFLDN